MIVRSCHIEEGCRPVEDRPRGICLACLLPTLMCTIRCLVDASLLGSRHRFRPDRPDNLDYGIGERRMWRLNGGYAPLDQLVLKKIRHLTTEAFDLTAERESYVFIQHSPRLSLPMLHFTSHRTLSRKSGANLGFSSFHHCTPLLPPS